ncbi:hypothetical protein [Bacteroides sedimenti]|uniref:Uncharacterized protein n=1 Tax=Bacteroides sedimenti TaxID=2136147 RepID=A0ABN6Z437_9BACE
MKVEDEIKRRCGNGNPFTVPEGYFENFKERIMEQLPEKEDKTFKKPHVTIWNRIRPWLYMTAVFAGILLGVRVMVNLTSSHKSSVAVNSTEKEMITDQDVDNLMDHSMMDDYSLYECLTEAE